MCIIFAALFSLVTHCTFSFIINFKNCQAFLPHPIFQDIPHSGWANNYWHYGGTQCRHLQCEAAHVNLGCMTMHMAAPWSLKICHHLLAGTTWYFRQLESSSTPHEKIDLACYMIFLHQSSLSHTRPQISLYRPCKWVTYLKIVSASGVLAVLHSAMNHHYY